jgi:hypothetical protein
MCICPDDDGRHHQILSEQKNLVCGMPVDLRADQEALLRRIALLGWTVSRAIQHCYSEALGLEPDQIKSEGGIGGCGA